MVNSITIFGKRHFNKDGNTYHSATVLVDGKVVGNVPKQYGYEGQYIVSASELLEERGFIELVRYSNGGVEPLWSYCLDKGILYYAEAADVGKESDL